MTLAAAVTEMRGSWRETVIVVSIASLAAGVAVAATAIASTDPIGVPALALPAIPSAGSALLWTPTSLSPSATQAHALAEILSLLTGLGWVGLGVAVAAICACYAVRRRRRDFEAAIHRAVGASLHDLEHSLMIEITMVLVVSMLIASSLAAVVLDVGVRWWPGLARGFPMRLVIPALVLAGALAVAAHFTFRAIRAQRLTALDALPVGIGAPTFHVAAAVALLLVSTALLNRGSPDDPSSISHGSSDAVLTIDLGSESPRARVDRSKTILDRLTGPASSPAVMTSAGAVMGLGSINPVVTDCGQCYVGGIVMRLQQFNAVAHAVTPGSLSAFDARLVRGRDFEAGDQQRRPLVAVVNRTLAARYFQDGAPIGRTILLGHDWFTVVGEVDDQTPTAIGGTMQPRETVYVSLFQRPSRNVHLLVSGASASTSTLQNTIRTVRHALGSGGTLVAVARRSDLDAAQHRTVIWCGAAMAICAAVVLIVAITGTITSTAIWAQSVALEFAIRRVVGARRLHIFRIALRRTASIALGGLALGAFAYAAVLGPAMSASIAQVQLPSFGILACVILIPIAAAVLVGVIPAVRIGWGWPAELIR